MKSSNTIVTLVIIAAVLIAAYGVGRLIQRARMGNAASPTPTAEANEAQIREQTAKLALGPKSRNRLDSPEARAKLKEKRAQALEKMESATPEQKEQMRQQVRERFGTTPGMKPAQGLSAGQTTPGTTPSRPADPNSEKTGAEPNAAGRSRLVEHSPTAMEVR